MRKLILFLSLLVFLSSSITVSAHPGRTDGKGGHYDRSTGEYHYHHGYSAHQHEDGTCPYIDYETETSTTEVSTYTQSTHKTNSSDRINGISIFPGLFGIILASIILLSLIYISNHSNKITEHRKTLPSSKDENYKFLKPAYAVILKKQHESKQNTKHVTEKRSEQIAGFPEGFYINCFTVNDLKSNEAFGRATAYINKKDNVVHLKYNCDNATTPINMLFDVYEMKNYKLCDKCCSGEKFTFYKNCEKWYKDYMKLQLRDENNDE